MTRHVRQFGFALTTAGLLACKSLSAAEPITFRLATDDKNQNSDVINVVAFSPDGTLVAAAFGNFKGMLRQPVPGQAVVWDVKTGRRRAALLGHLDGVRWVAFSPDGKLLATAGYMDGIKLWRTETLAQVRSIRSIGVTMSIAFSPDSKFLVAGLDAFGVDAAPGNYAELYEVGTGKLVRRFKGHEWGVLAVAFSPKGERLATSGSDGTVRIWNVASGMQIAKIKSRKLDDVANAYYRAVVKNRRITAEDCPLSIDSVAFSPDGRRLALAGGQMSARGREYGIGGVTICDGPTWVLQAALADYDCDVKQVVYSPDGKLLATAGLDGFVHLWDATTLKSVGRFRGLAPIAFSPDGKSMISSTGDVSLVLRQVTDVTRQRFPDEEQAEAKDVRAGLERIWSVGRDYLWTTYDAYQYPLYDPRSKAIFALHHGQCDVLGLDGKVRRTFAVDPDIDTFRLARFNATDQTEFAGFRDPWGDSVVAFNSAGKTLWKQTSGDGIDDVWAADLDGDGWDEVIVGYNGSGGLHVFNRDGKRRWKNMQLHNVWSVTSGHVFEDKQRQVISTGGDDGAQVFDANGKSLKTLKGPFDPLKLAVVRLSKHDAFDIILFATSGDDSGVIAAVDYSGKTLWTQTLPKRRFIESMVVCSTRPWVALCYGSRSESDSVMVLDCSDRRVLVDIRHQGSQARVAWATADDGDTPILLLATVRSLSAFQLKPLSSRIR